MVTDRRFEVVKALRSAIATAIYPAVHAVALPLQALQEGAHYFETIEALKKSETAARQNLLLQSQRASQVELLTAENTRLRQLLKLSETLTTPAQAAQVLYDAADLYSRKVVIDKGGTHGIVVGSPVVDESGVVGQVVRVFPLNSEVALVIDREQTTPVVNLRTGVRSVAYGNSSSHGDVLELRFISGNADVLPGDALTTSGMDGVYPAGLVVAKIDKIERRADSAFAKIYCKPAANVQGVKHVMVLKPLTNIVPNVLTEIAPANSGKRGAKK